MNTAFVARAVTRHECQPTDRPEMPDDPPYPPQGWMIALHCSTFLLAAPGPCGRGRLTQSSAAGDARHHQHHQAPLTLSSTTSVELSAQRFSTRSMPRISILEASVMHTWAFDF